MDSDNTNMDCLLRQYVSNELEAGITITGSQSIKAQCLAIEEDASNNMFLTIGIRIIASDASTVQKTVLAVTRGGTELDSTTLTNRQFTATSAASDYVTSAGDRLVIELGVGGDPSLAGSHTAGVRVGDTGASDLPEDGTSTDTSKNPWIEFTDDFEPTEPGGGSMTIVAMHHYRTRRAM